MNYVVIAYYTKNTPYEEEVQNLIASLEKHKLPMDIIGMRSYGSHQANVHQKPYFIKQMMIRHYPKDVLYLDADAVVQKHPTLFDHVEFDIGVTFRANIELLGGTLYFSNNHKTFALVERWINTCLQNPNVWDQQILQYILQLGSQDLQLKTCLLPETYCQIFDLMKSAGEPVIEQFQASRRFKKLVD